MIVKARRGEAERQSSSQEATVRARVALQLLHGTNQMTYQISAVELGGVAKRKEASETFEGQFPFGMVIQNRRGAAAAAAARTLWNAAC